MPLLGETLSFAKNPFRFIEERLATHGRIFRSNVLGRKTVVVAGPEAAGAVHRSAASSCAKDRCRRTCRSSSAAAVCRCSTARCTSARKSLVLQAFTRAALAAYLPMMQQTVERYFERVVEARARSDGSTR